MKYKKDGQAHALHPFENVKDSSLQHIITITKIVKKTWDTLQNLVVKAKILTLRYFG
jgi:hypothetical protein